MIDRVVRLVNRYFYFYICGD